MALFLNLTQITKTWSKYFFSVVNLEIRGEFKNYKPTTFLLHLHFCETASFECTLAAPNYRAGNFKFCDLLPSIFFNSFKTIKSCEAFISKFIEKLKKTYKTSYLGN